MPLKPDRIEVGDHVFYVRKPPPFEALRNFGDIQKLLAAPLAKLDVDGILDEIKTTAPAPTAGTGAAPEASAAVGSNKMGAIMRAVAELSAILDGKTLDWLSTVLINPKYVSVVTDDPSLPEQLTPKLAETVFEDFGMLVELMGKVAFSQYGAVFTRGRLLLGAARNQTASSPSVSSPIES